MHISVGSCPRYTWPLLVYLTIHPASCSPLTITFRRLSYLAQGDLHAILRAFQCGYRGDLYRRKCSVIIITLDTLQRLHKCLVPDHEADTPTGHIIAFAQREEFDGNILCPSIRKMLGHCQPSKQYRHRPDHGQHRCHIPLPKPQLARRNQAQQYTSSRLLVR